VPWPRPVVDIRAPPTEFDALVDWFDRLSYSLVLLEEYPPSELVAAVQRVDSAVREHVRRVEATWGSREPVGRAGGELRQLLASDHLRFAASLDQLAWFLHRVTDDSLGGHGQALGQYGRVFAEALRRHREDERGDLQARPSAPDDPAREKP
jgi:hypothetical protein